MGAAQGTELLRRLQAASLRAVSSEPQLELRGGTAWKHGLPLPYNAGHLYPRLDGSDIRLARGASDGLALRTRHSSLECHQSRLPESDGGRFIFELLEQLRCESLCSLPGVKTNLRHTFWHWAWQFHGSTLAETDLGQLLWAVCVLAHAKVNGVELPTDIGDRIEATRAAFPPGLGAAISNLRAIRHDQQAYALVAQEIASLVDADISARRAARGRSQPPARSAKDVRGFTLHLDVANEAQHYGKAALSDGGASAADPETTGFHHGFRPADTCHPIHTPCATRKIPPDRRRHRRAVRGQPAAAVPTTSGPALPAGCRWAPRWRGTGIARWLTTGPACRHAAGTAHLPRRPALLGAVRRSEFPSGLFGFHAPSRAAGRRVPAPVAARP